MRISIVIATFNAAEVLPKALASILNQSFQDWECIIVDGASKDGTLDIIKEYVKKDIRIRYISEPDKGIYDAFNKGWKMAKGEWIYYLGADDILLENAFDEIFKKVTFPSGIDIIYGNVIYKTKGGFLNKKSTKDTKVIRRHMLCSHQAIIMKKSLMEEMNGFYLKYAISADFDLIQRCFLQGRIFKYLDVNIAIFDCGGISAGIKALNDAYKLRKANHSVSIWCNMRIYMFGIIKHIGKQLLIR